MAVEVGSLFASLTLDQSGFNRGFAQAERTADRSLNRIQRQAGLTSRSVEGVNRSFSQPIRPYSLIAVSRAFDNTADRANLLRGSLIATSAVFGGFAAALTSNVILRYADTYTQLNNQLRVVSESSADLKAQFQLLEDVASRSRAGLKETAILYSRLSKAAPDLDPTTALRYTETIQKALQLGGATAQEAASAAIQFSQAIASNRLGGEELRAILETPLGGALAKGLGVSIGRFRELSIQGKLTADVVLGALENIGTSVDEQFSKSVQTLDQAITLADNRFIAYIGSVDEAYGVTRLLGQGVVAFANNLENIGNVLQYVVPLISGLFAAKFLGNIGRGFSDSFGDAIKSMQRVEGAAERAGSGITGAWRDIRQRTAAEVTGTREEIRNYAKRLDEARVAQATLNQTVATSPKSAFADKSINNALKRDKDELFRLDTRQLELRDRISESYQKLATVTGGVSPAILKATNAIADAESKVNVLLAEQKQLRAAQLANQKRQVNAAVGTLQRPGPTKQALAEVREAAKEEKRIQRDIAAAQKDAAAAREALSKRLVGLSAAEAAAARAASAERITALTRINQLTAEAANLEQKRAGLQATIGQNAVRRDQQVQANIARQTKEAESAIIGYSRALDAANARQALAARSATLLARSISFASGAFSSLFGFLGGPWGVALTAATIGFTVYAAKSAAAAQSAANAQEIISQRLNKIADSSDAAGEALERLKQKAKLDGLKKELEDVGTAFDEIANEIQRRADRIDINLEKGGVSNDSPFGSLLDKSLPALRNGLTDVNKLIGQIRDLGRINAVDPQEVEEVVLLVKAIEESSLALKDIKKDTDQAEASFGKFASTFSMMASAMQKENDLRRAVDEQAYTMLVDKIADNEKKIADEMTAALKSRDAKISSALNDYIKNQARMISTLDGIRAAADEPLPSSFEDDRFKSSGWKDSFRSNVRFVPGQQPLETAMVGDELNKLNELIKKIREVGRTYGGARQLIQDGGPLLNEQAFGTNRDADSARRVIEQVRLEAQALSEGLNSGKLGAIEVTNRLEELRSTLIGSGVEENVATQIVSDIQDAIVAIPKLEAQYQSLVGQVRAFEGANSTFTSPGGAKFIKVPSPQQITNIPALSSFSPGQDPTAVAAQSEIDRARELLSNLKAEAASLPQKLLNKAMFGDDPQAFSTGVNQAKLRIGEVTQKIVEGKIPAEDLGVAIAFVKTGLVEAGAQAGALDPFLTTLQTSLSSIDPVVLKIDRLTQAMERLATASAKVKLPASGGADPATGSALPRFAKGGAFKVGGPGGTDSRLVQFMASPSETVAVFTPNQMRALSARLDGDAGGVNVQVPITIVASDANSFKNSRRQVQMDIADAVSSTVNRMR